jgi:hypothetical protein
VPATGHTERTLTGKEPTCEEDGLTDGVECSVCGKTLVAQEVITAPGHKWKDATCTESKTCTACGATEGNALGHKLERKNGQDATCTAVGWEEYYMCSSCHTLFSDEAGTNIITEPKQIDSLGHDWSAATCTTPKTCLTCGETSGNANGHTPESLPDIKETCTEPGRTGGVICQECDKTLEDPKEIPATGHKEKFTYDDISNHWKYCSKCGAVLSDKQKHELTVEFIIKEPTCTTYGEKGYKCECGWIPDEQLEEEIKPLGHDYSVEESSDIVVCNKFGSDLETIMKCSRCGSRKLTVSPHKYSNNGECACGVFSPLLE